MGVEQKYPIEFNQAKDKVIERQIDDDDNEEIDFNVLEYILFPIL